MAQGSIAELSGRTSLSPISRFVTTEYDSSGKLFVGCSTVLPSCAKTSMPRARISGLWNCTTELRHRTLLAYPIVVTCELRPMAVVLVVPAQRFFDRQESALRRRRFPPTYGAILSCCRREIEFISRANRG